MTSADAHVHFFAAGYPGADRRPVAAAGGEVARYEQLRRTHPITDALVVGFEGAAFAAGNNDYLRGLAADRDWMHTTAFVATGSDPTAATAREIFAAGHCGISIYATDGAAARAVRGWDSGFWDECSQAGAVVSVNASPAAIGELAGLPERAPDCAFLFAHLGLPGRYRDVPAPAAAADRLGPLLRLADRPNCHVKISGLYAVSEPPSAYPHPAATPFVAACLERFGAARCLWGSDFAPALEYVTFDQCHDLPQLDGLAPADRQLVMGGNLRRLLELRRR